MRKNNVRKHRKIFILIIVIMITAITLAVETYAWFVGLSTASTGDITIAISSADGLDLSLNGQYWTNGGTELKIKDANHTYITETGCTNANCAYSGNTNIWPEYLNPVSTIGELNTSTSKLKLFEKQSIISNSGGYYITSHEIQNGVNEGNGYVAFDLFIRNGKGSAYNNSYNIDAEEDIYLSADSFAATVINGNQPDYGAANSVRVGFFEIGRVKSDGYNASNIINANCTSSSPSTPLCPGSTNMINNENILYTKDELQFNTWNIWEPNHASHSTNLVSYFNTACKMRTGIYSYGDSCQPIDTGTSKFTYGMKLSINNVIVNIYDGSDLNEHILSTTYLGVMKTYKTSDATSSGNNKTSLIKLGGNSITKVRVYIWLEGQDIDNNDIVTQNPSVQVKFGLTKDKYKIDSTNNNGNNNRTSNFQDDSWEKIQYNVQRGTTSQYNIGDMRTVRIKGNEYRLRLTNKSSNSSICSESTTSQTACGFVVEFTDSITESNMNQTTTNNGGYPATKVFTYLNGELWDNLPEDLKKVIINTKVISGHGTNDSNNFVSNNQKLYLLSGKEIFGSNTADSAATTTRQLDYYADKNVNENQNYLFARKQFNGLYKTMWLRTASSNNNYNFLSVEDIGTVRENYIQISYGIAPAFRIG